MQLLFVVMLWLFALGLMALGALNKAPARLFQERLDQFRGAAKPASARTPVRLLDVPKRVKEPFMKVALAFLKSLGEFLTPLVPLTARIEADLLRAGRPGDMTPVHFVGMKAAAAGVGFVLPIILAPQIARLNPSAPAMLTLIVAMMGWVLPTLWLSRRIKARALEMKVALPDMLDLIVLSMDAGIGFDGALGRAVEKSRGPLSDEMRRVLNEISHGKTRAEAFSGLAARCRMEDLSLLLAAINQSEQLGTSIGTALRIQVHEIRRRRTQELREMAAKLPVKMLIPLVVCIFPTVLLIVLGPAAILLLKGGIFGQ